MKFNTVLCSLRDRKGLTVVPGNLLVLWIQVRNMFLKEPETVTKQTPSSPSWQAWQEPHA